jgi:integral membrane protein
LIGKSLRRFQIIAWIAGLVLIAFTIEITVKYTLGPEIPWFAQLHGFVYMVYLALAFDLSRKANFNLRQTAAILLAGTIPLLSFYAERWATRQIKA